MRLSRRIVYWSEYSDVAPHAAGDGSPRKLRPSANSGLRAVRCQSSAPVSRRRMENTSPSQLVASRLYKPRKFHRNDGENEMTFESCSLATDPHVSGSLMSKPER